MFKQVYLIDLHAWDDLVERTYGRIYSYQQQDGCKNRGLDFIVVNDDPYDYENDSIPEEVNHENKGVSFSAWLKRDPNLKLNSKEEWDREYGLNLWWSRNFYPSVDVIAHDLYKKGLISTREFYINIDW